MKQSLLTYLLTGINHRIHRSATALRCIVVTALLMGGMNVWGATKTIEFTTLATGISSTANTTAAQVTVNDYIFNYYQCKSYSGNVMLTKNNNPYFGNETAIPGKITKVEMTTPSEGSSSSVKYTIGFSDSPITAALSCTTTLGTGAGTHSATNSTDASYFAISIGNSNNGQINKITVTYEEVEQTKYPVSWYVEDVQYGSSEPVAQGSTPTVPADPQVPDACQADGKVFVGWIDYLLTDDIEENEDQIFKQNSANIPTIQDETWFYAVFANSTTTGTQDTEAKVVFKDKYGDSDTDVTSINIGSHIEVSFAKGKNTDSSPKYYSSGSAIRMYTGNTFTISSSGGAINRIVLTLNSTSYKTALEGSTISNASLSILNPEATSDILAELVPTNKTQPIIITIGDKQVRVNTVAVYYGGSSVTTNSNHDIYCSAPECSGTKLDTPTGVSSTAHPTSIDFSWDAVTNATVTKYTVYLTDGSKNPITSKDATTTSCTIDGLSPETVYLWSVKAWGNGTTSCDSEESTSQMISTIARIPLGTPTNLTNTEPTQTSVTLSWNAVQYASGYKVTVYDANTSEEVPASNLTINGTTCEVTGLTKTTDYEWYVQAVGMGDYIDSQTSATASFKTASPKTYTIEWYNNGQAYTTAGGTTSVTEGGSITDIPSAPSAPETCSDKKFVGWTTAELLDPTDTKPTLYKALSDFTAPTGSELTIKYYAVFADEETTGSGSGDYEKITSNDDLTDGDYLIVYEASKLIFDGSLATLDAVGNTKSVTITSGVIEAAINDNSKFTITSKSGGYSIKSASGYYIGQEQKDNGLKTSEADSYVNTIIFTDGNVEIVSSEVTLLYNSNTDSGQKGLRFRYYKTAGDYNKPIQLYKKVGGTTDKQYVTQCEALDESRYHNVTVAVSPAGATGCSAQAGTDRVYDTGTTTLTATVGAGYTFAGWDVTSGTAEIENATSTSATLKNITSADVTVTANFVEGTYHLVTTAMPALTAGDELLIASYWDGETNPQDVVAGDISDMKRLQAVQATFSDDKKIVTCLPAGHTLFTLGGEVGAYTLRSASGHLTASDATDNDLEWTEESSPWEITIKAYKGYDYFADMRSNSRYLAANLSKPHFIAADDEPTDVVGDRFVQLYRKNAVCSLTATLNTITYPLNSTALDVKSLTATYTDGKTTKTLALTDENVEHSAIDFTTTGTKKVTFSYTEDGRTVTSPEYTITVYDPNEKYTVTFYNVGTQYNQQTLSPTETVTKPADPQATGDCEGRVFYGWSTAEIEGEIIAESALTTIVKDVTTLKATTNLYAVYADVTVDHTAKYTATQITSESDLEDGGLYMIVQSERAAINSISNKALVTTTNYNLTNLEGNEPYVWKFVMDGAGYIIYSSADNTQKIGLVNTGDTDINLTTSTIWYITYATDRFKIQASTNTKRYLKYNADNNYKAYSNNTFTPDETNNIQLYKLTQGVAYSHFSTSCACNTIPTLTIDLPTEDAFPVSGDYMVELKTQGGNGNPAIQWSINSKDAKIDDSGHLVAIAPGVYEITAKQLRYDHKCTEIATHTIELTAPTASFALTFINNGKTHEIKIVEWGQYVSRPTTPVAPTTCSEYKFVGWSTTNDVSDVTKFAFYDFSQRVKADATLYAVYSTETCAATYNKYTLDGEQAVTSGDLSYKYILTSPDGTYAMLGTSTASGDGIRVGALGQGTAPTTLTNPSPRFVWDVTQESTGSTYDNYSFYNQYTGKYLGVENGQFVLSTEKKVLQMYYDEFGRFNLGDYITDDSNEAPTFSWDTSEKPDYSHAITMKPYSNAVGFCFYQRTCKVDISKYTLDICEPACEDIPTITRTSSAANSVTIAWDCTAETAKVVLYSDAGGTQVVEEAKVTAKTHTFGKLQAETKYYVRVFAGEDQTCESALQAITTTESTLDIVDWGTYENGKVGVTINLTDVAADKVSVGEEKVITNESTNESLVQELFFSKYYEAAGSVKLIGIYNPTNAPILLEGYHVYVQTKEYFSDAQHHFALNEHDTEIPAGTEYIFYHDGRYAGTKTSYEGDLNNPDYLVDADSTTLGTCINQTINGELGETDGSGVNRPGWFLESACDWGGKHSIALFKNGNLIDIIGAYDGDLDKPEELKATTSNQKDAFPAGDFPEEEYGTFQDDLDKEQTAWFAGGERYDPQEGEPKLCVLSTNRCLLIRKRNMLYDITLNDGDFGALSKEWLGRPVGTSTDKAADRAKTCKEFSAVSSFDYAKYYVTYETVVDNQQLSGITNADGTYTIPIDNIAELACKNIKIDLLDNSNKAILSQEVRVPIIIESTTTTNGTQFTALGTTTEESAETCRTCDVVVKNDAVLTHADNAIPQIGNLIVQDGAKLKIADDKKFTVASVTLRSDKDVVPHLVLPSENSELESKAKSLRFTKRISNDRYYFFSLPFDCNVDDIMLSNGQKAIYGTDILILYYDGAKRVQDGSSLEGNNWVGIDPTEPLVAGQGYALAVATDNPTEVIFPMTFTSTALHIEDNKAKAVEITAHGFDADGNNISGRTPNNVGWNFVGNPYFTHYGTLADTDLKHGKIAVVDGVVGDTWIDETNLYVNIPDANTDKTYTQKTAASTTLSPFFPFFVQVAKTGTLEYVPTTRQPVAIAARYAAQNDKPVFVGVSLSNGKMIDETSLVINDRFTQAYEVGFDLEKLLGLGQKPQVYIRDDAYRYAFKALNENDAAATNMLGVYLPAKEATTYTFDVMRGYDLSRVQGVYLTDHVAGTLTNLLQGTYTFTTGYAYTNNRFSLSVVLAPKAVTSLTNTEMGWSVWQDAELHIRLQGLTVGDDVRVVDATGKLVEQLTTTDSGAQFGLPAAGAYCVQVIGMNGLEVRKIVVR